MHRVFCTAISAVGTTAELEDREKEHLFRVFRAAPGDAVELLDGAGKVAGGVVLPGREVRIETVRTVPEPAVKLHLVCALPRRQKLDQLLKQAAELGAWSIRPLRCVRSVAEGDPRERWELLLREACKQSGNPFLPRLYPEEKPPQALARLREEGAELYYGAVTAAPPPPGRGRDRALLIGPEGGFAPEELALLEAQGAKPFHFAPYTLRLETAAVCGLTALRMLGAALLAAGLLTAGCGKSPVENNPLLIKGAKLRDSGELEAARRYFRRAVALHPDEPTVHLALAQLCDESLDDPLEALYCYRNYRQLTGEDDPRREAVDRIVAHLESRVAEKLAGTDDLRRENRELKRQLEQLTERNRKVEAMMIRQQLLLNRLNAQLTAAKRNNSGRKR